MTRMARNIEFGRHIAPRQVARRLQLQVQRAWRDRIGPPVEPKTAAASLAAQPPLPLYAPRVGHIAIAPDGYRLTFLNRTISMHEVIVWDAPGPGPAEQLWRMCLHYMEYLEELGDADFTALIDSWIAEDFAHRRGAWRDSYNSYTVSLRAVVWMQQLASRAGRLGAEFVARTVADLRRQLLFLERNLETDIGGNHLIKNIKALIWASAFFAGAEAARWRAKGLQLLATALSEQVLPDGMHYERSPSYHCQVFADLLECRCALGGDPLEGMLDEALARMAQTTADLTHPDGKVALFNDAGLAMAYDAGECLSVYERLLGPPPQPRNVVALAAAGYYGLREGDTYFVADCGPIAPDRLVAHGHGDVLSFEWSVAGRRIVVDQGVYEYSAGERRQRSRSAASHNTLCFEGADQADFFGSFRCGRRPRVHRLAYQPRDREFMLEGTHDGFVRLDGSPRHVRRFEVSPQRLTIRDRVEGQSKQHAAVAFLLHPGCEIALAGRQARVETDGTKLVIECSVPLSLETAVWWPDMGVEIATYRLRGEFAAAESGDIVTHFTVSAPAAERAVESIREASRAELP